MTRRLAPLLAVLVAMVSLLLAGGMGVSPAAAEEGDPTPTPTTTTVDLTATPSPTTKGSVIVGVGADDGESTPSGAVRMVLTDDSGWTGRAIEVTLDDAGAASASLPKLNSGDYTLTADYQGDDTHASSTAQASFTVAEEEPEEDAEIAVEDAVLRWGINNESNNSAFFGFNYFSAGRLGSPGTGAQTLNEKDKGATWANGRRAGWSASAGNVRIEKQQPDGAYALTSWAARITSPAGGSISPPGSAVYSHHQIVFGKGTGKVDLAAGTATIQWDGDATIIYYSGFTFWYLSDPRLTVKANGTGTLTATVGGFGADMENPSTWVELDDRQVTLANLSTVELTERGVTGTPTYEGVRVKVPAGAGAQVTTGKHWGSFPQDFVTFQALTGQNSYWYSSGLNIDAGKVALPLAVSFSSKDVVIPPTPTSPAGEQPQQPQNPLVQPPALTQSPAPALPSFAQPAGPSLPSPPDAVRPTGSAMPTGYQPPVRYALTSASTSSARPDGSNHAWEWSLGFLLLLGAAGITVFNPLMHRLKGTR